VATLRNWIKAVWTRRRRRVAEPAARLNRYDESDVMKWIEAVSEFDDDGAK
jgi:hypothetical protein